jgi:hypothetical protein
MSKKLSVICSELRTFLLFPLALFTGLGDVKVSAHEERLLTTTLSDWLWRSNYSKSFLAWRRRLLYFTSVLFLGTAVIQVYELSQCGLYGSGTGNNDNALDQSAYTTNNNEHVDSTYTTFGKVTMWSKTMAPFSSMVFTGFAAWNWTDYIRSRNTLLLGWMVGLVLVVLPNIVPLKWTMDNPQENDVIFSAIASSLGYLPSALAITGGLSLGSEKVFAFGPSPLTGAMIVMSAVFSIVLPFIALSLLLQFLGTNLAFVGVLFLFSGPALILVSISKFTGTNSFLSQKIEQRLVQRTRIILVAKICRLIGFGCLLLWFYLGLLNVENFSSEYFPKVVELLFDRVEIDPYLTTYWLVEKVVGFLGGMAFQGVLWTDIVVHIARNDDDKLKKLRSDIYKGDDSGGNDV